MKSLIAFLVIAVIVTLSLIIVPELLPGDEEAAHTQDEVVLSDDDSEEEVETTEETDAESEYESEAETHFAKNIVTDALDYTREIIPAYDWADFSGQYHTIRLPKIDLPTEGAQGLNDKIYNDHSTPYETLLNYAEEEYIVRIDYEYKVYKDVIGIVVEFVTGPQHAGAYAYRSYYYYNIKQDREVTFDEYISELGYTKTDLERVLKSMEDLGEYESHKSLGDAPVLDACIADENSTFVVFSNAAYTMNGVTSYEVGPVVKKVEKP